MAKNYAEIAFTEAVKALQEEHGSRSGYERMEKQTITNGLSEDGIAFIQERDSFYLASIGANNFPYIQHRGGPAGFLKVVDKNTIGFIDFSGNKQFISVGNLATNTNVSLILMNYAARSRLKIFAKAEIIELDENPALVASFDLGDYKFRPERIILLHIEAYDWNCPQHITPRYTTKEIKISLHQQFERIDQLEKENRILQKKLKNL